MVLRSRLSAYTVYLIFEGSYAVFFSMIVTLNLVYQVEIVHLNPLQLVLVGTLLEGVCFILQVPTGALADITSRRACIVAGTLLTGAGFMLEGLVPRFGAILLAQVIWGAGSTLLAGAEEAWIAGEVDAARLGRVFLRGSQAGQAGALVGAGISVALGGIRLNVPIVAGGALLAALALVLVLVMPERATLPDSAPVERPTWRGMGQALARSVGLVRGSPLLLTILALPLFFGMSGEGFDRLAPDHFIRDYTFPALGPLKPVVWFGIMAVGATLLGLGITEVVRRRLDLTRGSALGRTLAGLSLLHVATYIGFGLARSFPLALACYWGAYAVRRASAPLYNAWLAGSVEPRVRATIISTGGLVDALGQIAGGPVIGFIGTAASLRAAMVAAGVALSPAVALYLRAGALGATPHDMAPEDAGVGTPVE